MIQSLVDHPPDSCFVRQSWPQWLYLEDITGMAIISRPTEQMAVAAEFFQVDMMIGPAAIILHLLRQE